MKTHVWICLGVLWSVTTVHPRKPRSCEHSSCHPATGDLLQGRAKRLTATSTCGLFGVEKYCTMGDLNAVQKCFECDSRNSTDMSQKNHRVQNIIFDFHQNYRDNWWQSKNGVERVTLQLDLEAEFLFTHLILTFKTFRPAAMYIERSSDFGQTWRPYRYFAQHCAMAFPRVPLWPPRQITDVVCDQRYSDMEPSTGGEVIYKVLEPSIKIKDPYSKEIQDLLHVTNLRVVFMKLHTMGDNKLNIGPEARWKYHYALYSAVLRGSCFCYGHAQTCTPASSSPVHVKNMVNGNCACKHNTNGMNCEQCKDFHHDTPWRPAKGPQTNACKRCECNGHSERCYFDHALYMSSGNVSGGLCLDCQHNTTGQHCDACRPTYYLQPGRSIRDPDACQPCNCNPLGTLHKGACDPITDPSTGAVAGTCHCKPRVQGPRCEQCLPGHHRVRRDDPGSCRPIGIESIVLAPVAAQPPITMPTCRCDPLGTEPGRVSCNRYTGACVCKRFTTGRDCDQCLPGFWGLSTDKDGCRPCECDFGGAHNNRCSQQSGQCSCRSNIIGRTCDQVPLGHFCMPLDMYTYEAEEARFIDLQPIQKHPDKNDTREQCDSPQPQIPPRGPRPMIVSIVQRKQKPDQERTWTGPGFARVRDGAGLEFTINNIPASAEYELVIRYETEQLLEKWEVLVRVFSRSQPSESHCANALPTDELQTATLHSDRRYAVLPVTVCLESGITYTVDINVQLLDPNNRHPSAHILIDSLVLFPQPSSLTGSRPTSSPWEDFKRYRCADAFREVRHRDLTQVCQQLVCSTSAILHNGAIPCDCHIEGSLDTICDRIGGQCRCKPNIIGRRCDTCISAGTDLLDCLSPNCDCDPRGSLSPHCDPATSSCRCLPRVAGPHCKACLADHFGFPSCQPCRCPRNSLGCDPITGACLECTDDTDGERCQRCIPGYYSDPAVGCKPCLCPGHPNSGYYHATSCYQDPVTRQIACNCQKGYEGDQCNVCAPGYSGNPMYPGRKCVQCNCNGNTNSMDQSPCDPNTGNCLRCLYHTTGPQCERCEDGYYGDATRQNCRPCDCDIQGALSPPCDPVSGHCYCRTGVAGPSCKACLKDHFAFPRCQPCRCHGSQADCDPITGACTECRENTAGEHCDRCMQGSYGDPAVGCRPCPCPGPPDSGRYHGISCSQDPITRKITCSCQNGYAGAQCNVCAPGYFGNPMYPGRKCVQCNCNSNTNPMEEAPCDSKTGDCLRCLYHTTGPRCERCEDGYYGDATRQNCRPCDCDIQGALSPPCDPMSGHCYCRTGVAGPSCKACLKDHFAFPRCQPCHCHGSQADCDPITGACMECPENMEGKHCERCKQGFYSDPATSCQPCPCPGTPDSGHYHATSCFQDIITRQITCNCHNGYSGALCNVCARGYSGTPTYPGGKCVQCNCNGNTNSLDQAPCDPITGNCLQCLHHTTGPRCERCEDGYYGDATKQDCLPCDCNAEGALSPPCDPVTGECRCRSRVAGTSCKACLPDHFGFPTCQRCSCRRNSVGCDPITGACLECLGNTEGEQCERCVPGYYGDPAVGCQPCPCPGGPNSGRYHGTSCSQNPVTRQITCNCTEGYTGQQCSKCALGYSGNPMYHGRKCLPCVCNGNSDPKDAAACNNETGSCQHCLHNTAGPQCERCEDGYYGNAKIQECQPCNCHEKATEPSTCEEDKPCSCNANSGQCRCLPGVVGQRCDSCAPNHWGLSSRKGCQPCDCHPERSLDKSCDEDTGQCQCKQKFGGKTCSDCQLDHWGTPNTCCTPCDCDHKGILSPPCDKATGRCRCKDGVSGKRCDTCARGYWGIFPNCQPCHSCFLRWGAEVADVVKDTDKLKLQADSMVKNGVRGAYEKHFSVLEENLGDIQRILEWQDGHEEEIKRLQRRHNLLRDNMNQLGEDLEKQEQEIKKSKGETDNVELQLDELERNSRNLNATARSIMRQLTLLLNSDYRNAFTSIRRASDESQSLEDQAKNMVSGSDGVVALSKKTRERVENLMEGTNGLHESLNKMQGKLGNLRKEAEKLDLKSINEKLCGSPTAERCEDSRCGGAGCRDIHGQMACGGPGCSGAKTLASDALKKADDTAGLLENAKSQLQDLGNKVESIQRTSNAVKEKAQRALDKAQHTKDAMNNTARDMKKLLQRIKDFLNDDAADSDSIALVANKVLAIGLPDSSADITRLMNAIRTKIDNLKDIDTVIDSSTANINLAQRLLKDAQDARKRADDVHDKSVDTQDALNKAQEAQDSARQAIDHVNDKLHTIENSLAEKTKQLSAVDPLLYDLTNRLTTLADGVTSLQNRVESTKNHAVYAENLASTAKDNADQAKRDLEEVRTQFLKLKNMSNSGSGPAPEDAIKRALSLQKEAQKLVNDTLEKLKRLNELEVKIKENDDKLQQAQGDLTNLEQKAIGLIDVINTNLTQYVNCQS